MSAVNPASRSFGDWYMDSSIPGHAPLIPSIFVGKVCQWIVSPLDENGCEAMIEVISRILAVIVLPLIALIALLLIPIGLITKSIGGCCVSQAPAIPPAVPNKKPKMNMPKKALTGVTRISRSGSAPQMRAPAPTSKTYPDQTLSWIAPAKASLEQVDAQLKNIGFLNIDIDGVRAAKQILDNDINIQNLIKTTPLENAKNNDPIVVIRDRINLADARIKSLEFIYHYHSKHIEHDGEMVVPDNGDCLFEASRWHSEMNGSIIESTEAERLETMRWIEEKYSSDEILQRRLVNSMAEHYQTKLEKLEVEQKGKHEMLHNGLIVGSEDILKTKIRLQEISQEMDSLCMIMVQISGAFGQANNQAIDFSAVQGLVGDYIRDMSQKGEHGGAAELYALSCRHKVCIQVHHKNGKIDKEPYETINDDFKEKPPRHFTHTRNHYNPFFPVE